MFNREEIEKAIRIHKLGYQFLLYLKNKMDRQEITFSRVNEHEESSEVFFEWMNVYYDYLPASILPDRGEIRAFSNYFASYLTTSFAFIEAPENEADLAGCYLCLQMKNLAQLKIIPPGKADKVIAAEKRIEAVKRLGDFYGMEFPRERYTLIANHEKYLSDAACLAYVKALFERIASSAGGVYILALWRQFAWVDGKRIRGFELETDVILNSIESIKFELLRS